VKDALERKLHKLVCAGQLDLRTAQREIAANWIQKLRNVIAGRTVQVATTEPGTRSCFGFVSSMKIKTAGPATHIGD
jgi:hypothetical protein